MDIKLNENEKHSIRIRDSSEEEKVCCICGESISGEYVEFIIRVGHKSSGNLCIHKKHFSEEALKLINKRVGEEIVEKI